MCVEVAGLYFAARRTSTRGGYKRRSSLCALNTITESHFSNLFAKEIVVALFAAHTQQAEVPKFRFRRVQQPLSPP